MLQSNEVDVSANRVGVSYAPTITSSFRHSHIFHRSVQSASETFDKSRILHSDILAWSVIGNASQQSPASDRFISKLLQQMSIVGPDHPWALSIQIDQSSLPQSSNPFTQTYTFDGSDDLRSLNIFSQSIFLILTRYITESATVVESSIQGSGLMLQSNEVDVSANRVGVSYAPTITSSLRLSDIIVSSATGVSSENVSSSGKDRSDPFQQTTTILRSEPVAQSSQIDQSSLLTHSDSFTQTDHFALHSQLDASAVFRASDLIHRSNPFSPSDSLLDPLDFTRANTMTVEDGDSGQAVQPSVIGATIGCGSLALLLILLLLLRKRRHQNEASQDGMNYEIEGHVVDIAKQDSDSEESKSDEWDLSSTSAFEVQSVQSGEYPIADELFRIECDELLF
jgi:hypothetical protein